MTVNLLVLTMTNGGKRFVTEFDGTTLSQLTPSGVFATGTGLAPNQYGSVGGTLLFRGRDAAGNFGLWTSDGTTAGTSELTGISAAATGSGTLNLNPTNMTAFNGALYFTGNDSAGFIGLWRSDGTAAGTVEVQRSTVPVGGSAYGSFFVSGTKMYFAAADASGVFNLNVMDTTGAINKLSPSGVYTANTGFSPSNFIAFNNGVLFAGVAQGTANNFVTELWFSDGTSNGTVIVSNGGLPTGATANNGLAPSGGANLGNGKAVFAGYNAATQVVLYVTDGTSGGTSVLSPPLAYTGSQGLAVSNLFAFNGKAYFSGFDTSGFTKLWVTDGTSAGTVPLAITGANSTGFSPSNFTIYNGSLYFTGSDTSGAGAVFKSDGTATGTSVVAGTSGNAPSFLTAVSLTACFAEGTSIRTTQGDIAVEHLVEGDIAILANDAERPIVWIGKRHIDLTRHPRRHTVQPIRVQADAFGPGLPLRDLILSPDHAVYADGVLIPVQHLVNGTTISVEPVDEITYWHVELDQHDIVLAHGLPCESYLDTGNRDAFENGDAPMQLHPGFGRDARAAWEIDGCARLIEAGPQLEAVRTQLAQQATALGERRRVIPELIIEDDGIYTLLVPAGVDTVHLVSRAAREPGNGRLLGALLRDIRINGATLPLAAIGECTGFHTAEIHGTQPVCWTNGRGELPLGVSTECQVVELHVAAVIDPPPAARAAA